MELWKSMEILCFKLLGASHSHAHLWSQPALACNSRTCKIEAGGLQVWNLLGCTFSSRLAWAATECNCAKNVTHFFKREQQHTHAHTHTLYNQTVWEIASSFPCWFHYFILSIKNTHGSGFFESSVLVIFFHFVWRPFE